MGKTGYGSGANTSFGPFIPWVVILVFFGMGIGGALGTQSAPVSLATAFVSAPGLNVRAGPGRDHSVLATLSQGDAVQLLGEEQAQNGSTWVRVRAAGQDGWVSLKYLSAATGGSPHLTREALRTPSRARVTLQYQRPMDRRMVQSVRAGLERRSGWRVTGPEHVLPAGDNRPETYGGVRFFFEADSTLARAVCSEVVAELARHGMTVTMPLWPMITGQREGRFSARQGLVEVWISPLPPAAQGTVPVGQCGR